MGRQHAWKKFEVLVGKFFGTRRNPLSGSNSGHTHSDTLHDNLFIECKYRAESALDTLYQEVEKKADEEGKVPVICLKKKKAKGFFIVLHSTDFPTVFELGKELIFVRRDKKKRTIYQAIEHDFNRAKKAKNPNQSIRIRSKEYSTDSASLEELSGL
jgi:hypothetical protein